MNSKQRDAILKQCAPGWQGQYQPLMLTERGWAKLNPEQVVDLLANPAHTAYHASRQLLERMQSTPWRILATVHEGGKGSTDRTADSAPHVTLRVGSSSFHLRCKEQPRLHLIAVTA